ncbi:hypothetical protein MHN79_20800 [Vibrio sp. Of14-4]|uniref:hypothetical protein n=1 Tax=Vibrio sp. Of14-4 TaxID=2724878 RepID=UPI001EF1BFC1|nr:hypothetical protein [Vibrio sp. Of14-4]MCG7491912.1 hypothetical protein [Vibrio sp. Of14-4]
MSLDDLIDEVVSITSDEYEKCILFMIRCLPLVAFVNPEVGIQGITTATRYWIDKSADKAELDRARVACWNYLDTNSASTNIDEKKFCAVNGELLEWFFQMLSTISNDDNALLADLSEILADHRKN